MTRKSTLNLHAEIKKDFDKMLNIRDKNAQKFTTEYIINTVAEKYFKSSKTIENIVFNRVKYS